MPRKAKPAGLVTQDVVTAGRPTKLTPETMNVITNALTMGSYFDVACLVAGITPRTAEYWLQMGRAEPGGIHAQFLDKVKEALARSELRDLSIIDTFAQGRPIEYMMVPVFDGNGLAVRGDDGKLMMKPALDGNGEAIVKRDEVRPQWTAAAWKLERRAPKRWGRTDRLIIDDVQRITEPVSDTKQDNVTSSNSRIDTVKTLLKDITDLEEMEEL